MLKAAIEKIVSLANPEIYMIGEETYSTVNLRRVDPHVDRPAMIEFGSLDAIVKSIATEIDRVTCPVFVIVETPTCVEAVTTYRQDNMQRDFLYRAKPSLPKTLDNWMGHDDAMIALRSRYIETEDTLYIIDLLSSISDQSDVKTTDNGLTQQVTVKQGIALKQTERVKPRVTLKPYRTFLEVEQPASEFLLRMRPGDPEKGKEALIGLFEADGGAWKLEAKHSIAQYFEGHLKELIEAGKVIVVE